MSFDIVLTSLSLSILGALDIALFYFIVKDFRKAYLTRKLRNNEKIKNKNTVDYLDIKLVVTNPSYHSDICYFTLYIVVPGINNPVMIGLLEIDKKGARIV